jgi:hypothetical protein
MKSTKSLRNADVQGQLSDIEQRTGWWFGTFFIFPYIGNNHPN